MPKRAITIPMDSQTVKAYNSVSLENKKKMQILLGLWIRELAAGTLPPLQQVLEETGRKAQARGLTPEKLDSLLKDE